MWDAGEGYHQIMERIHRDKMARDRRIGKARPAPPDHFLDFRRQWAERQEEERRRIEQDERIARRKEEKRLEREHRLLDEARATEQAIAERREALEREAAMYPKVVTIMRAVSEFYGITMSEMKSRSRKRHLVLPRHVAMYLAHEMTLQSWGSIALVMYREDHTSPIYAHRKIEGLLKTDARLAAEIEELKAMIQERVGC